MNGDWAGPDDEIGKYIGEECGRTLQAYRAQPNYVLEHANHEQDTARGGYADRQLFELVQNGADALSNKSAGRIEIRLTDSHLYCADSGEGIDTDGVKALMFSYLSPKRGTAEIGRFGLGFKSVLGVSDSPEFFSRSGSFKFDRNSSKQMIQRQLPEHVFERYPVLRLAMPIDPGPAADEDHVLRGLMHWATNIVRLPLMAGAYEKLAAQAKQFPAKFLLFVRHVEELDIRIDELGLRHSFTLTETENEFHLSDENHTSRWKVFHRMHRLSEDARTDSRALDDAHEVPIWWATPLEGSNPAGNFWAFFPTSTPSLVPGILNAPWKTNEDRQNLLTGVYNDELVSAAAELIADNLHHLSTAQDPAKHVDALPRRARQVDRGHTVALSNILFRLLYGRPIIPDMTGALRRFDELEYPPVEVVATRRAGSSRSEPAIASWYAANRLNNDWLHRSATTPQRWTSVERLCDPNGTLATDQGGAGTPVTTVSEWLEALVRDAPSEHLIYASKSAIRTAALLPEQVRNSHHLGSIILVTDGTLDSLDTEIYLPSNAFDGDFPSLVHSALARDVETRQCLFELGVEEVSPEAQFEVIFDEVFSGRNRLDDLGGSDWERIWDLARAVPMFAVRKVKQLRAWSSQLRVQTISGEWVPAHSALLPGAIVPEDGTRDDCVAINADFSQRYETLLRNLDISDRPHHRWDLSADREFIRWRKRCRNKFAHNVSSYATNRPRDGMLNFVSTIGFGPTTVIEPLSHEGSAVYTEIALNELDLFRQWTMRHDTRSDYYRSLDFAQPAIEVIRKHGHIQTFSGIVPFADALGEIPKNREAQRILLEHPNAEKIKELFDLHDPPQTRRIAINADPPVQLVETWPGLGRHLDSHIRNLKLIRCQFIVDEYGDILEISSAVHEANLLVTRMDREDELRAIGDELNVLQDEGEFYDVLNQPTDEEIEANRARVRAQHDDASRLLEAVGKHALQKGLPAPLVDYYLVEHGSFTGIDAAKAAISTHHTGALRHYRRQIAHLDPPPQWAGSSKAIEFVTELGFPPEWAGERNTRREPFMEVPGPIKLPDLHDYQQSIASNLRQMLRSRRNVLDARRGMISLPTGSGKTRVAVEGIVNAMVEDGFSGGVLWVADRDELCEQAVEAWQEIWRAFGTQDQILRISRMWAGQPPPEPTSERHVVVASIQTLASKLSRNTSEYDFLTNFQLVVFDEAHRSIATTFTSALQELGFTRRLGPTEPYLLGLTATPYRGYNETETSWLARRYGQNRLDRGAFESDKADDVMRDLQDMQVLARADHQEIEGTKYTLSWHHLQQIQNSPWLPDDVQDSLARNTERTRRIIDAYKEHIASRPELWPTLIFATSVEHAQTLAAILSADGISARAVSGGTDRYTRRQVVEQFRAGELKVLVNYGVFREGFDAPKTRAIIVARPVYSPNLYFQMIGRGLRGVMNGGNERCLILDVNDNIVNFERNLAFTELDWLWD